MATFFHLKIMLRNLQRGGIYSAINIGGLAIGMAASILLLLWIHHEWSYDRFHEKEKQLYQVWFRVKYDDVVRCSNKASILAGPALKDDYPDIVESTRVMPADILCTVGDHSLKVQTARVDPGFLTMFSFQLQQGNADFALNDPNSMVLTEKAANRLFGNDDPMGKTILIDNEHLLTVTGIMKDLPNNTSFEFEALMPIAFGEARNWYNSIKWWGNSTILTYVELHPLAQEDRVNQTISSLVRERTDNTVDGEVFVFPLSKSHLYTKSENGIPTGGLIDTLRLFGMVAFLILLIACINFMNLSTARGEKRAKEVGVRKVMGGKWLSLIRLFLSESILLAFIAGAIAIWIVALVLPIYNSLLGKTLSLDFSNGWFWLAGLAFIIFTGLLAGSYPAFHLSSFLPVKVLKGAFRGEQKLMTPRRVLVVAQFTVAVFLITATLVIHRQVQYAQSRNSGYQKQNLIYHPMTGDIHRNYELIKHELLTSGVATSVTRTLAPMTQQWANTYDVKWRGSEPNHRITFDLFFTDSDWGKTVGATIVEGRDIDIVNFPTDATAVLLNESAVKTMGLDNPIGETMEFWGNSYHVVGVIKDFILHSPYEPTKSMIIVGPGFGMFSTLHIRLNGTENLTQAEAIFKKFNPTYPFEYNFIDVEYARKYQNEKTMGVLSTWFAALTIFISCLGLFALVAYMAEIRKKEIGIRKVLGASVSDIIFLLSKEFFILVLISIAIATPVALWAMNKWLSNYAYRTDIPWWLFVVVGCTSLCIALLTVGFQAIKAATANPVDAIKSE